MLYFLTLPSQSLERSVEVCIGCYLAERLLSATIFDLELYICRSVSLFLQQLLLTGSRLQSIQNYYFYMFTYAIWSGSVAVP